MAGNYGFNPGNGSSPRRRVHVLRGFNGCEPDSFTKSRPVANGETIYSGQVMSLNSSGEWVLGQDTPGKTCYIALSNHDDTDVKASGKLPGLSCAGQFEIETPWYDDVDTYVEDTTKVVADSVELGSIGTDGGATVDTIIGKVTRAPYKLNEIITSGPNDGTAVYPFQSNELGTTEVITFITVQD